jgi:RNA 3'-phosphate cyclase
MIELDGAFGEGGGQILRTSLTLALITGQRFKLTNIRANRPKPGLQAQHLTGVRAATEISQARVHGDRLGSRELVFEPGPVRPGKYHFAVGTAGATGLVLHTVYLPLAWKADAPSEVTIDGGTHVSTSPCFHFLDIIWRAYLARMGLKMSLRLDRTGFYPRGGGRITTHIQPCQKIEPLIKTDGTTLTKVTGFSATAGLPEHIARRQEHRAKQVLERAGLKADIHLESWPGGPGSVVGLCFDEAPVPTFFFALGERGKPAEAVGAEAADQAVAYRDSGAPVDLHSADQIVLPLALADGESRFRVSEVTRHLTTNLAVIGRFLKRQLNCDGAEGEPGDVHIGPADV